MFLCRDEGREALLRGERKKSGRGDSKINRRNLSKDREISLTMRALVRAKWSERSGRWRTSSKEMKDKDLHCTCSGDS